ncbi:MAG: DNA/RNA nuclease SfsA [Thermodesulfobacteriota bacterium]
MNTVSQTASAGKIFWPELVPATLIRRYQRFLIDVRMKDGSKVTAHCPNSGSMLACCEPGRPVYLSCHDNPRRRLTHTWELIDMPASLVGVNTLVPNRLVFESLQAGRIDPLAEYPEVLREVLIGNGSRLDFLLKNGSGRTCYVEVKNCTLVEDGVASFPDAVTARGQKHLRELQRLKAAGARSVMFFLIQRMDAALFKPADRIDPDYGRELRKAVDNGVEVLVYDVKIDLKRIVLNKKIPCQL